MPVYLAVAPEAASAAAQVRAARVHIAYAVTEGGALARSAPPRRQRGDLMGLGDRCPAPLRDTDALVRTICAECAARQFSGVMADFSPPVRGDRLALLERLAASLAPAGRRLYVPEAFAVPEAYAMICTAVSGGTLEELLRGALRRRGSRLALDVQRVCMDFPLPCPDGAGQPLDRAAFAALRRRHPSPVFFSPELCARYFTYSDGESAHFVLFDDARTLRRKLRLAREAGIDDAFFMYPEVADLSQELFAPGLEAPFDSQRQI